MAKKYGKEEEKLNYTAAVRELKQLGPERVYLLWGPEDYLREQYPGIALQTGNGSWFVTMPWREPNCWWQATMAPPMPVLRRF